MWLTCFCGGQAQGQALERKLKATQTKLDETAESLAACLADKAKQTPAKDTVTKTVYNECVQQSETARKDFEKTKKELKQLKVELETVQKAAKDASACNTQAAAVDVSVFRPLPFSECSTPAPHRSYNRNPVSLTAPPSWPTSDTTTTSLSRSTTW
jgi:hypothetical protein